MDGASLAGFSRCRCRAGRVRSTVGYIVASLALRLYQLNRLERATRTVCHAQYGGEPDFLSFRPGLLFSEFPEWKTMKRRRWAVFKPVAGIRNPSSLASGAPGHRSAAPKPTPALRPAARPFERMTPAEPWTNSCPGVTLKPKRNGRFGHAIGRDRRTVTFNPLTPPFIRRRPE